MRGKLEPFRKQPGSCAAHWYEAIWEPPSPSLDNEGRGRCGARLLSGGQSERLESGLHPRVFWLDVPLHFHSSSATDPPSRPPRAGCSAVCVGRGGCVGVCGNAMAHPEFASHDTTPMDRFMQLTKNREGPRTWLSRASNRPSRSAGDHKQASEKRHFTHPTTRLLSKRPCNLEQGSSTTRRSSPHPSRH